MGHGEGLPVRLGPANMTSFFIFSFTETFLYLPAKKNQKYGGENIKLLSLWRDQSVLGIESGWVFNFGSINHSTCLGWAAPLCPPPIGSIDDIQPAHFI